MVQWVDILRPRTKSRSTTEVNGTGLHDLSRLTLGRVYTRVEWDLIKTLHPYRIPVVGVKSFLPGTPFSDTGSPGLSLCPYPVFGGEGSDLQTLF